MAREQALKGDAPTDGGSANPRIGSPHAALADQAPAGGEPADLLAFTAERRANTLGGVAERSRVAYEETVIRTAHVHETRAGAVLEQGTHNHGTYVSVILLSGSKALTGDPVAMVSAAMTVVKAFSHGAGNHHGHGAAHGPAHGEPGPAAADPVPALAAPAGAAAATPKPGDVPAEPIDLNGAVIQQLETDPTQPSLRQRMMSALGTVARPLGDALKPVGHALHQLYDSGPVRKVRDVVADTVHNPTVQMGLTGLYSYMAVNAADHMNLAGAMSLDQGALIGVAKVGFYTAIAASSAVSVLQHVANRAADRILERRQGETPELEGQQAKPAAPALAGSPAATLGEGGGVAFDGAVASITISGKVAGHLADPSQIGQPAATKPAAPGVEDGAQAQRRLRR